MKLIRKTQLIRRQASVLHCEVELCQLPDLGGDMPARYVVNLRQGRDGEAWRESTRTPQPVALKTAEAIFDTTLAERLQQGFVEAVSTGNDMLAASITMPATRPDDIADSRLVARLHPDYWRTMAESQRCRTIWRIGERRLSAAVPALVPLLESGTPMQDYCLAWSIGRCGDSGAAQAMQILSRREHKDTVRRIALQAWLQLAGDAARQQHAEALVAAWPAALRAVWATQNSTAIEALIAQPDTWTALPYADWLEQLDQVALCQPLARRLLLTQLATLPLQGGTFRAVRHLYKVAEFRDDAELFGLLHQRFETVTHTVPGSGGWIYLPGGYTSYAKEVVKPDSRVAYNAVTRDYLRRRTWRRLRRLGEDRDPAFVTLAQGVLLAMDDASAGKSYSRAPLVWDAAAQRSRPGQMRHYGPYSHWMLFNRLLHAHSTQWQGNRSGRSWSRSTPDAAEAGRSEAFPALWDAQPDALLRLLQHSRCAGVHAFAARALQDNLVYCDCMAHAVLHGLLQSRYSDDTHFAFQIVLRRLEQSMEKTPWLLALLHSTLAEARTHALDLISRDPVRHGADTLLIAGMLCAADETVRLQGRMLCQGAANDVERQALIILALLDWLEDYRMEDTGAGDNLTAITGNIVWVLQNLLQAAAAQAPYPRVRALLDHPSIPIRALAGDWLVLHTQPVSLLPSATLTALLQDDDPALRSIGIKLFGALPDHVLLEQPALFAAFCCHPNAAIRQAIEPALQRLAPAHPAFSAILLPALLDCLFRAEPAEGVHADLLQLLQGPLQAATGAIDRDTTLRLLQARSKGAQQLGAILLPHFVAGEFSVREWALLGCNENASVRRWAVQAYMAHADRVRMQMDDALRIFNGRWDDSHLAACDFFRTHCNAEDWTPLLLVNLCDHLDPAVQRFGREMLTTHFNVADVTEYLLKLSQHPSASMQLFVSTWLESSAAGNLERLQRLESYFLAVLSQVNRGRIVKNRVLVFLQQQTAASEAIAGFVARLFARQVVTVAITDKALYIEGLRAIQARYPALPPVLTIQPPRPPLAAGAQP